MTTARVEALGRLVRAAWVLWAKEQPSPKHSWLVPWDELGESDKEADRRIGVAIEADTLRYAAEHLSDIWPGNLGWAGQRGWERAVEELENMATEAEAMLPQEN